MSPVFNEFYGSCKCSEQTATLPCHHPVSPTSHDYTQPVTASVQLIAITCVEYLIDSLSKTKNAVSPCMFKTSND